MIYSFFLYFFARYLIVYFSYNKLFCTLFLLQKNDIIKATKKSTRREDKMDISKKDWDLFKKLLPEWQEAYMERLIKEYILLLNEEKLASDKF